MAEVSARIKVTADASEAKKVVSETESSVERLKAAAERTQSAAPGGGAGGGSGGGGNTPPVDPRESARNMADEFGRRAGAALAKFVVGYMVNQGVGTAFALMRRPGEDSRRIDQAEQTLQGAIQWGTAGAQMAGPIGAVVGGFLGGLNNFILKEKEIRDALAKSRVDYNRERNEAAISSGVRQQERAFDWMVGHATPDEQVKLIRKQAEEWTGKGQSGQEIFDRFMQMRGKVDHLEMILAAAGSDMAGVDTTDIEGELKVARLHLNGYEKMLEGVASGKLTDERGRPITIGGNEAGTKNWYEAGKFYSEWKYGTADEAHTGVMNARLAAMNALIDPMREKEQAIYLAQMDKMMGLASRSAITDSASSKGLGVGAQIGGMANNRMLTVVQDILRAVRTSNKDFVDVVRARGGVSGMLNGAVAQ